MIVDPVGADPEPEVAEEPDDAAVVVDEPDAAAAVVVVEPLVLELLPHPAATVTNATAPTAVARSGRRLGDPRRNRSWPADWAFIPVIPLGAQ